MPRKVKSYTAAFKFKIVMESIQKDNVAEVARKYDIHPNKLSTWRSEFNKNGHLVFENSKDKVAERNARKIKDLENLIGKKEIEINILKGYVDFYSPLDGK
jgi:transposase